MEGEEKRREAGGWLSISLSTFCPARKPGRGGAPLFASQSAPPTPGASLFLSLQVST